MEVNTQLFRTKVQQYCHLTSHSQEDLAKALGLHRGVLSRKLNAKTSYLTHGEIMQIVKTLAAWDAISTQQEAVELLELMGLKRACFDAAEWQRFPLDRLDGMHAVPSTQALPVLQGTSLSVLLDTLSVPLLNLPTPTTCFIGRENEVAHLVRVLSGPQVRLLTLVGAGGVGKTCLALKLATDLVSNFADGVHFINLACINEPVQVLSMIAQTFQLPTCPKHLRNIVISFLRFKQMLLILDSFEHVIEAAPLVTDLLTWAPSLKVLVTSRRILNLYGEHQYTVLPLRFPDLSHLPEEPVDIMAFEAVALLIERVRAYVPDFTLTKQNARVIVQICHLLDGLPLALELAAARMKFLTPQALLKRLEEQYLQLLSEGAYDLPPRQQSLRQSLDWSYTVLDDREKLLFRRLAVFKGKWTLPAAEAMCAGEGLEKDAIPGLVSTLVDHSLIQAEHPPEQDELEYFLMETTRHYAQEKLIVNSKRRNY